MKNPDNSWILYGIAISLILDAVVLRRISKRIFTNKGKNSDVALNGNVNGKISQTLIKVLGTESTSSVSDILALAANICAILGLILAAATFYLTYM